MKLFTLDPGLAIWTWITFGILFFILAKFVIPGIVKNLREREEYIHSSVEKSAEADKRLKDLEKERSAIVGKARKEADTILLDTRREAESLKKKLTEEAEEEARRIVEQAREEAEKERQAMIEAMQDELAEIVCSASEKVIGFSFTGEKEKELSRELVREL